MTGLRQLVAVVVGVCSVPAILTPAVMLDGASKRNTQPDIADPSIGNCRTVQENTKAPHYSIKESVDPRPRAEDRPDWPFIRDEGELSTIEKIRTQCARAMIYLDVIGQADAGDRSSLTDFKNRLSPRFRFEFIEYHLQCEEDEKRYIAAQWQKDRAGKSQAKCNVRYYNARFGYGFDLPTGGDPVTDPTPGDQELELFDAGWIFKNLGPEVVLVGTNVGDQQHVKVESLSLYADITSVLKGYKLLSRESITLSNGDPGALRISYGVEIGVGVVRYRVTTIKDNRSFCVVAIMPADSFTLLSHGLLTRIVGSLCVD